MPSTTPRVLIKGVMMRADVTGKGILGLCHDPDCCGPIKDRAVYFGPVNGPVDKSLYHVGCEPQKKGAERK